MANKNHKTQIYDVNLLKPYHQRSESINLLLNGKYESLEYEPELEIPYPTSDPNVYDFEEIVRDSALRQRLCPTQIEEQIQEPIKKSSRTSQEKLT
ncbi:hypothetical protein AVEN_44756-1 [Araneus ventricosus]|uniref:Uncharacterized protein n=1 Tax=Araneus ventricosus TaxID=182803 RepID=A0A4Y2HRE0_ARAVE|nr:hypothetical protein AVEN_44756-1 [Araneus ventricosus]